LRFDISTDRMNEFAPDVISNDLFDLELWRRPYIKLLFREYRKSVLSVFQQNQSSQYKDRSLNEQIRPGNSSHAMATCLGLVLEPITPTTQDVSGFKAGLISVIPKELEQRPNPINVYTSQVSFEDAASNITGLSTILDIQGSVGIRFYRKFENAGWFGFRAGSDGGHDKDTINGRIRITDITEGITLFDSANTSPEGTVSWGEGTDNNPIQQDYAGEHIIRIRVEAFAGDGWKQKVYPYLTVQLANELSEYTGETGTGRTVHLWPKLVTETPTPVSSYGGSMGVYPRSQEGSAVRKFEIDIPSNQIANVYTGLRYWKGGSKTSEDLVRTKIDFGPTGLVYFRRQ